MNPIPTLAELQQFNVNRPDAIEAVRQGLWDTQTYVSGTTTALQFFQVPKGQSSKTMADTNMEAAGALPAPKSFLIETIELYCFPKTALGADNTSIKVLQNWQDLYDLLQVGWLELFIGSKAYLDEGPLMKFPPRSGLTGVAFANDSTANTGTRVDYVSVGGPIYQLDPNILLVPTQNFVVTLNWATAKTLNANVNIVCNLGGILYRNSQ